jgi:hypothetical protein
MEEAGAEVVASLRAGKGQGPLLVVEGEERRLLEAARGVEARRKEVAGQLATACGAVNGHFDAVVAAAERRRGELLASLESRKDLALAGQQAALEGRAGRLGALRADVEQRAGGGRGVVALVESATRLREEARAIKGRAHQDEGEKKGEEEEEDDDEGEDEEECRLFIDMDFTMDDGKGDEEEGEGKEGDRPVEEADLMAVMDETPAGRGGACGVGGGAGR